MSSSEDAFSFHRIEEAMARLNATISSYKNEKNAKMNGHHRSESDDLPYAPRSTLFSREWDLSTDEHYPHITNPELRKRLNALHELCSFLPEHPYNIDLYLRIAKAYVEVGYPDLAVGSAYKALLLIDAINNEDEFCDEAIESLALSISKESLEYRHQNILENAEILAHLYPEFMLRNKDELVDVDVSDVEVLVWTKGLFSFQVYALLAQCLHVIGCQRSAAEYCFKAQDLFGEDPTIEATLDVIHAAIDDWLRETQPDEYNKPGFKFGLDQFPDEGMVRRECYPWNEHEPDRCSDESLEFLNAEMEKVAPRLEVKATKLPLLTEGDGVEKFVTQLGVFAKEDIAPGDIALSETSLLTANNRLQDALCDACSADLPELSDPASADVVACPDCEVVFCSEKCSDLAQDEYHPAICDRGVEDIAKDVPPAEAANALYSLLLLRSLAMAETQEIHPLDIKYVKFIWGDYHTLDLSKHWRPHDRHSTESPFPRTLAFSFQANVVLPFNMLEKMDVDIFKNPQYDVWVFNTLYAKFRGTASARLSGSGGGVARGPEVSAVHPMWCLANHSCNPNVTWRWASDVRFRVLEERPTWHGSEFRGGIKYKAGLKKGEEVLSHYCDIDLPVKDRREWAAGALGGNCCCERCLWEACFEDMKQINREADKVRR
ncbi:hypothetical protein E4T50_03056 [Aureobasidium sp. EXF-12298]|nr:hypothetical protein E4T50_03056 [Aureobasidium sp. EXF-12298]KAI4766668.1 hypothetical protein E4T51_00352 [Aureobasidium sp. EXF-12344]KAI4784639.1 hypothetical protein E4T52_00528 [Aureobasidium sp. EXF-3400]